MNFSRRQFLFGLVTALTAQAAPIRFASGIYWMQDDEPGPVDDTVIANLLAMVETLVHGHGSIEHYRTYFNWRTQNLPRYKPYYELFSIGLDEAARTLGEASFIDASDATRQAILTTAIELPHPQSALLRPTPALTLPSGEIPLDESLWLRFDQYIIGEMIMIYTQTNAWIMLGYDAWPGVPRGLDRYPLPVEVT